MAEAVEVPRRTMPPRQVGPRDLGFLRQKKIKSYVGGSGVPGIAPPLSSGDDLVSIFKPPQRSLPVIPAARKKKEAQKPGGRNNASSGAGPARLGQPNDDPSANTASSKDYVEMKVVQKDDKTNDSTFTIKIWKVGPGDIDMLFRGDTETTKEKKRTWLNVWITAKILDKLRESDGKFWTDEQIKTIKYICTRSNTPYLIVARSKIKGANLGVFSVYVQQKTWKKNVIMRGDTILNYVGKIRLAVSDSDFDDATTAYMTAMDEKEDGKTRYVDANPETNGIDVVGLAPFINDIISMEFTDVWEYIDNDRFPRCEVEETQPSKGKSVLTINATQSIPFADELYWCYGSAYWEDHAARVFKLDKEKPGVQERIEDCLNIYRDIKRATDMHVYTDDFIKNNKKEKSFVVHPYFRGNIDALQADKDMAKREYENELPKDRNVNLDSLHTLSSDEEVKITGAKEVLLCKETKLEYAKKDDASINDLFEKMKTEEDYIRRNSKIAEKKDYEAFCNGEDEDENQWTPIDNAICRLDAYSAAFWSLVRGSNQTGGKGATMEKIFLLTDQELNEDVEYRGKIMTNNQENINDDNFADRSIENFKRRYYETLKDDMTNKEVDTVTSILRGKQRLLTEVSQWCTVYTTLTNIVEERRHGNSSEYNYTNKVLNYCSVFMVMLFRISFTEDEEEFQEIMEAIDDVYESSTTEINKWEAHYEEIAVTEEQQQEDALFVDDTLEDELRNLDADTRKKRQKQLQKEAAKAKTLQTYIMKNIHDVYDDEIQNQFVPPEKALAEQHAKKQRQNEKLDGDEGILKETEKTFQKASKDLEITEPSDETLKRNRAEMLKKRQKRKAEQKNRIFLQQLEAQGYKVNYPNSENPAPEKRKITIVADSNAFSRNPNFDSSPEKKKRRVSKQPTKMVVSRVQNNVLDPSTIREMTQRAANAPQPAADTNPTVVTPQEANAFASTATPDAADGASRLGITENETAAVEALMEIHRDKPPTNRHPPEDTAPFGASTVGTMPDSTLDIGVPTTLDAGGVDISTPVPQQTARSSADAKPNTPQNETDANAAAFTADLTDGDTAMLPTTDQP